MRDFGGGLLGRDRVHKRAETLVGQPLKARDGARRVDQFGHSGDDRNVPARRVGAHLASTPFPSPRNGPVRNIRARSEGAVMLTEWRRPVLIVLLFGGFVMEKRYLSKGGF